MTPTPKKIRSQPTDVVVAVGSGDQMQEFDCYKVVLSLASDYFDAMLSASMRETETSRIEFPDKNPEEWKQFYAFIDPGLVREAKINDQNAMVLLPWFHEFQMDNLIKECDKHLYKTFVSGFFDKDNPQYYLNNDFWSKASKTREKSFQKIVKVLEVASRYDLERTREESERFICYLMDDGLELHLVSGLFTVASVKKLVPLCLPLENGLKSRGTCVNLWSTLYELIEHHLNSLDLETINSNNELFPVLVHSYIQLTARDCKLQQMKFGCRSAVDTFARRIECSHVKPPLTQDLEYKMWKKKFQDELKRAGL